MNFKNKECLKQWLWMLALVLPWGIGGFVMHTAASLSAGMLLYWGTGLVIPILFFLFQRKGWGSELGAYRAATHCIWWLSFLFVEMTLFWNYLPVIDGAFKANKIPVSIAVALAMALFVTVVLVLDYVTVRVYQHIKAKGGLWASWAGLVFVSGLIPGLALTSFLALYAAGGMRLDPFTASFFLMEIFSFFFYGKIVLAMVAFGVYLFFALEGSKGQRITQVIFSAIFWIMVAYIPFVISLHMPGTANWRAYLDPSYLSIFPILSDMWMMGLSLFAGQAVTKWIFKDSEK